VNASSNKIAPYTISHVFDAPRSLVYEIHCKPDHLSKWMGGEGFEVIHNALDHRVGGAYHYGMRGPGGMEMWGKQSFLELVPERKIVLLQSFSDKDGGITRHPMSPTWQEQMHATTTFEDAGEGKTKMTISMVPHNSDDEGVAAFDGARAGMEQGFGGMFKKMDAYLASLLK